ncbi:MAG: ATP-binding protein [Pseudomonadota bacterium]
MKDEFLPLSVSMRTLLIRAIAAIKDQDQLPITALSTLLQGLFDRPGEVEKGCGDLGLSAIETLLFRLVLNVEWDPDLSDGMDALGDTDKGRPTAALLSRISGVFGAPIRVAALLEGPLFQTGLIRCVPGVQSMHRLGLAVSDSVLAALQLPSAVQLQVLSPKAAAPETYVDAVMRLRSTDRRMCLVMRGDQTDARRLAYEVAQAQGKRAFLIGEDLRHDRSLAAALTLAGAMPVETITSKPGTRTALADLRGYASDRIVITGQDGGVQADGWDCIDWQMPNLTDREREAIWQESGGKGPCPDSGGPSHIAAVAARVKHGAPDKRTATGAELKPQLEPHATIVGSYVPDAAMVCSAQVRAALDLLLERCQQRRLTRDHLGPAFHAKGAQHGLKAMLCGPSGGGKTLAASWLASKLDQPLFKVDLSSVVSKYIGETEENLARVLDRAEQADVILLFDEADALFGARTETKDSSDRFANNQTNYLLGRIEDHSGIVLLTTNARQRIDPAFSRRLDQVIEMVSPDARERQGLWRAHLGGRAEVSPAEMTRLANAVDLSGGHIRTIVLSADVMAVAAGRMINFSDICAATVLHYRGIGRSPPSSLRGET